MFDEYTENVNNKTKYGVLYTNRTMSGVYDAKGLTTIEEEKITLALKITALNNIKEEVIAEYHKLSEQYHHLLGEEDGNL